MNILKYCALFFGVLIFISILTVATKGQPTITNGQLDKCIQLADQAHLDPNDDKVDFIKTCLE